MTRRRRPRTAQERVISVLGGVAPGSLGGRIRNTRPAVVPQPNKGGPPATGFDPNADPILIGNGADVESNDGPGIGQIAIGLSATVGDSSFGIGNYNTAIGSAAIAGGATDDDDSNTAVGANTAASGGGAAAFGGGNAQAVHAVAVGNADATGDSSVAVGDVAHATALRTTAVGAGSRAQADYSTALGGAWCNTSATQGVSIGAGSQSLAPSATSVGAGSVAATDSSIAIGNGASANGPASIAFNGVALLDHEVVIGGASDTYYLRMNDLNGVVVQDDDGSGTMYRITVSSGALGIVAFP